MLLSHRGGGSGGGGGEMTLLNHSFCGWSVGVWGTKGAEDSLVSLMEGLMRGPRGGLLIPYSEGISMGLVMWVVCYTPAG